jgi:hypothetical protein
LVPSAFSNLVIAAAKKTAILGSVRTFEALANRKTGKKGRFAGQTGLLQARLLLTQHLYTRAAN